MTISEKYAAIAYLIDNVFLPEVLLELKRFQNSYGTNLLTANNITQITGRVTLPPREIVDIRLPAKQLISNLVALMEVSQELDLLEELEKQINEVHTLC